MRTALRASIATAVLAGALLAPIAGTAYAATTTAPAAAAVAGTVPDRYAGTPVLIGTGVVAVLRNKSEGPEVWIRAVSDGWKPGDDYTGRALATLDVKHLTASVNGLELELVGKDSPHPSLSVAKGGTTKSYPLPQAAAGPADCVSKVKQVDLGAGLLVDLTMSPKGPKAHMHSADPSSTWSQTLTRTNPKGSEAYFSRINNPSGAKPVFEWKTQGGENVPSGFETFPALPKGCTPEYPVHDDESTSCVSKVKQVDLGAGLLADLTMSPKGPKAHMHSADPSSTWSQTLTRTNPKGSEAYFSRINNPSGAKPVFEWKTQGGENVPSGFETFPALPKGCTPEYQVTEETPAPKPEPSATKPVTATNVSAQTTGQTTVVPQGSVAAGAEIESASEDTDNSITLAAGAGLLSVFAALGATVLRRRRSHS
ncbi:hypothetical protein [Streptomyces virginiae]|uniref:hypothetical protein n=1 Tax=Streptomyces virginiae TaxID=1961 RepID=UPI00224F9344|nr:hypothetical protein [Streptomyces virginiae]MCX5177358.1 hypothetical protein [Streptomyces virginiae]